MEPSRSEIAQAALTSARLNGCICDPDLRLPNRADRRTGIHHVTVLHDDWCPLAQTPEMQ